MTHQANEVVKANNLSDTIIVLHGRVEVWITQCVDCYPLERVGQLFCLCYFFIFGIWIYLLSSYIRRHLEIWSYSCIAKKLLSDTWIIKYLSILWRSLYAIPCSICLFGRQCCHALTFFLKKIIWHNILEC